MADGSQPSARSKAGSLKRRGDRLTPAMAQYMEMKAAYPDALLFFRMGDFYEMFFEDAKEAAAALNLTLTKRGHHAGEDVPMCGVPVRTAEVYLARLIRAGFNVAVCEQTEDVETAKRERGPSATLRRAVVRLVTPGTLYEDALLDSRSSAYLAAVARNKRGGDVAIAAAELSTGRFILRSVPADAFASELAELAPAEIVAPPDLLSDEAVRSAIAACPSQPNLTERPARDFTPKSGEARLKDALGVAAIEAHGAFAATELAASGGLIAYIAHTQVDEPPRLSPPTRGADGERLQIDPATRASLELLRTQRGERAGSVLDAIDRTVTGAGARLLAARLAAPLAQLGAINRRLDAVAHFKDQADLRAAARDLLKGAPDLARALGRLDLGKAGPRDLLAVREALACAADLARLLDRPPRPSGIHLETPENVADAAQALRASRQFPELLGTLQRALEPEAPLAARDGGFIAAGYHPGLDEARTLSKESRRIILELEGRYGDQTGIKSLKIKHNNVLGYFIETPSAHGDALMAPPHRDIFIHRQTMANAVRFTTAELTELDVKISKAGDRALGFELDAFAALCALVLAEKEGLSGCAEALAELDALTALALLAEEENYCRPHMDESWAFRIEGGRHPVVEQALRRSQDGPFIANDCDLTADSAGAIWLVTGPNMAGKSTFLRQNALIAALAQAGSFVPATRAHIGVADKLFSRVGASDDLARGRSTFMVEMIETAAILNQATDRSLVILDEIGRGTSTFDGLSIAWAASEHLHDANRCRTLFATHYHELTGLADTLARLVNVSMRVREWKGGIRFLHEVGRGAADRSYGVQVARLAGLPRAALERADELLRLLETEARGGAGSIETLPLFQSAAPATEGAPAAEGAEAPPPEADRALRDAVLEIDPETLTLAETLDLLERLKRLAEE